MKSPKSTRSSDPIDDILHNPDYDAKSRVERDRERGAAFTRKFYDDRPGYTYEHCKKWYAKHPTYFRDLNRKKAAEDPEHYHKIVEKRKAKGGPDYYKKVYAERKAKAAAKAAKGRAVSESGGGDDVPT